MSSKVLVLFAVLCMLGSCYGVEETTRGLTRHEDIPIEPLGAPSDPDLNQDATFWRFWKFWKWDSQRTVTRRESSLITTSNRHSHRDDWDPMYSARSTGRLTNNSDSGVLSIIRTKGSVKKEIVTSFFESMLDHIVYSWDVIQQKYDESINMAKSANELSNNNKKKKGTLIHAKSKIKSGIKNRSKMDLGDFPQIDPMQIVWWSAPDEKVVIHFKNGNIYEGNISMKAMHGEGRFQWADGTVYLGEFKDNEIKGKGLLRFKNDAWYEGEFFGNLRHGYGIYVDSRRQRCYNGNWDAATKHGDGVMYYDYTFSNSYDGEWDHNVRHGYGIREYCPCSGYEGEWEYYKRQGKGFMIFSNHDLYKGEWKNGVISGFGMYIWDAHFNNTMSLPSIQSYRGHWLKGLRTGMGILTLGLNLGAHYKGEFKNNKKHGSGRFVTMDGLIIKDKYLFNEDTLITPPLQDNLMTPPPHHNVTDASQNDESSPLQPYEFNIVDSTEGLRYHIEQAYDNLDRHDEIINSTIREYIKYNKYFDVNLATLEYKRGDTINEKITDEMINYETNALLKATKCYETKLKNIYYTYATICNTEEIYFVPILIRLYLWQFYYDCDLNEKSLTFTDYDELLSKNPDCLAKTIHGPFEKIYLKQFMHCLIFISILLYAKRVLPGPAPDTVVASAFRYFMDTDVVPNIGRCKGYLTQDVGSYLPLKRLYKLYTMLGEPLPVLTFLRAMRRSPHLNTEQQPPELIEAPDEGLLLGRNAFVTGDEMAFIRDELIFLEEDQVECDEQKELILFNFGNLSSKRIIAILSKILPQVSEDNHVMNLHIQMTFFDFFQAIVACSRESYNVKEEELHWLELLTKSTSHDMETHGGARTHTNGFDL